MIARYRPPAERPLRPRAPILALLLVCLAFPALSATPSPDPYRMGAADYFWIPASLGMGLLGQIRYQGMEPVDTAALDPARDLWAMDRWAAGNYSPPADLASNLMIYPMVAVPLAAAYWERARGRQGWEGFGGEAAAYLEALSFTSGLDLWVRSLRVHARPLVYARNAPADKRLKGEASGSFYSGHANAAFLSATFFSYTWTLRHPGDRSNAWVWTGALAAATGVAGLRIAAGKHYLSDVLVGAVSGAGFGILFPWMHRRSGSAGGAEAKAVRLEMMRGIYPAVTFRF